MMMKDLPQQPDQESLSQLSKEELVSIIIEQAILLRANLEGIRGHEHETYWTNFGR